MVKVAIYARVSTDKQELDNQLEQLRHFADALNWNIYKEYTDIIKGSKDSRPEWDQMFSDAHKKLFDIVLFWSFDRFSRSGTLYTLQKLHELELLNIGYRSYQEQYIDSVGMFKDTVISIFATIAKAERERISERTKAGLKCICGHKRTWHEPVCRCGCVQFIRDGARRGKDKNPRQTIGYLKKRKNVYKQSTSD